MSSNDGYIEKLEKARWDSLDWNTELLLLAAYRKYSLEAVFPHVTPATSLGCQTRMSVSGKEEQESGSGGETGGRGRRDLAEDRRQEKRREIGGMPYLPIVPPKVIPHVRPSIGAVMEFLSEREAILCRCSASIRSVSLYTSGSFTNSSLTFSICWSSSCKPEGGRGSERKNQNSERGAEKTLTHSHLKVGAVGWCEDAVGKFFDVFDNYKCNILIN